MDYQESKETTASVLQLLNEANASISAPSEQNKYVRLPFTNGDPQLAKEYPKSISDELVIPWQFLIDFNATPFNYDENRALVGREGPDGKFVRKLKFISYKELQSTHTATTKKFTIKDMKEYGRGLAAKEKINKGEIFFYPGDLTSVKALARLGYHQPYSVSIFLQEKSAEFAINAASCEEGYAQLAQHAPSINPTDIKQVALSNMSSSYYYTKVKFSGKMFVIPLLAFEFMRKLHPNEGIFIDYSNQYWEGQLKAPSYFDYKLRPVLEQVQLNVSQNHLQKTPINITLRRPGINHILQHGYVSSATTCYIFPQCSQKALQGRFNDSGFVSCNGIMLPAIILINAKEATMSDDHAFLVIDRPLSKETVQTIDNDHKKEDAPAFIKRMQMFELGDEKALLMIPIKLFQELDITALGQMINYLQERTKFGITMHCDHSQLPLVLEDKKEESNTHTTPRP